MKQARDIKWGQIAAFTGGGLCFAQVIYDGNYSDTAFPAGAFLIATGLALRVLDIWAQKRGD